MMMLNELPKKMPGLRAPAFFVASTMLALMLGVSALAPTSASAQQALTTQPPQSVVPVPGQMELSKMVWSTILAVDHANKSGNYSVLRDMSSQGFQILNNSANLGQVFAGLRADRVDLSNALLVAPSYLQAPLMVDTNVLQVNGVFQIRPVAIYFDFYYIWEQGVWKLHGIDLRPMPMAAAEPEPTASR